MPVELQPKRKRSHHSKKRNQSSHGKKPFVTKPALNDHRIFQIAAEHVLDIALDLLASAPIRSPPGGVFSVNTPPKTRRKCRHCKSAGRARARLNAAP